MKQRLDLLLVKAGCVPSREKAKAAIGAGIVFADGVKQTKASAMLEEDTPLELRGEMASLRYVSRGGLKLEKAIDCFQIGLQNRICMDIGASTGGFTDCMLQNGARLVYAIDVGSDQLSPVLRQDERVICMEKTNFRYLEKTAFEKRPDFASVDVSFISLSKILPAAREILEEQGEMVCLIKPQFEAGREKVGKNGVVKDAGVHRQVLERILEVAEELDFSLLHLDYSPIRGPEGNLEYLAHFQKRAAGETEDAAGMDAIKTQQLIAETVKNAHAGVSG